MTFAPDHKDDHFSDAVRIELFGQEEQHVFRLVGKAKSHIMYMYGGDPLTPDIRSLTCLPLLEIDEGMLSQILSRCPARSVYIKLLWHV